MELNPFCDRVCAPEHALSSPYRVLEHSHGLAEVVERGAVVLVERPRVIHPDPKRGRVIDPGATLDDLREAATTLEDAERIARRVFGGTNPITTGIERSLSLLQATFRVCETPPPPGSA